MFVSCGFDLIAAGLELHGEIKALNIFIYKNVYMALDVDKPKKKIFPFKKNNISL
jgi:hypothetical protein